MDIPPPVATVAVAILILGLFRLDRDRRARTSKALWVPTLWLLINASRPVSQWLAPLGLNVGPPTGSLEMSLEGSPLDRSVYLALLAAGLIVLAGRRRQVGVLRGMNAPILLFFSYSLLSILWSDFPFIAFKHWTKGVGDVVMVLVVLTDPEPDAALKRILARASFLLIPLSVLFIKKYPNLGWDYNVWNREWMYRGVTTFKNMLGMTCLLCGLGSLWSFLAAYRDPKGRERRRRLTAHGAVLLMVFWLFWESNSMTSISCFIVAGSLMVVISRFKSARKPEAVNFLVTAAIGLPLFALFTLISGLGGGIIASLGRDPTLTGRPGIWKATLSLSGNPLLGTGYESFWLGDRLQKVWDTFPGHPFNEAHNGYLEVYLNLGLVGLTLLASTIVTGYRNVVLALRRNPALGEIRLAFFVAGVVYSFTEAGFRMMAPIWFAFLLAITAVPEAVIPESSPALGIRHTRNFAQPEPQLDHVFDVGFPGEIS